MAQASIIDIFHGEEENFFKCGDKVYAVNGEEKVVPLENIPQSSIGAPIPIVLSDEQQTVVAYYTQEADINDDTENEIIAIISFKRCRSTMFGPPNDEAFSGHPLYPMGLKPYSSFIVEDSSWLKLLTKMNEVHPYHNPKNFADLKHYILSFHDTTFECIAKSFEVQLISGTMSSVLDIMKKKLGY